MAAPFLRKSQNFTRLVPYLHCPLEIQLLLYSPTLQACTPTSPYFSYMMWFLSSFLALLDCPNLVRLPLADLKVQSSFLTNPTPSLSLLCLLHSVLLSKILYDGRCSKVTNTANFMSMELCVLFTAVLPVSGLVEYRKAPLKSNCTHPSHSCLTYLWPAAPPLLISASLHHLHLSYMYSFLAHLK